MTHYDDIVDDSFEGHIHAQESQSGLRLGWALGLVAFVAILGFMLFDVTQSETYFYEVHQAVAKGPDLVGQTVRIKGKVEPGSIRGEDGKLGFAFRVTEGGKSLEVRYDKALPDTFEAGREVVAQGEVDRGYVLQADEVLVKCPSRYEGEAPTAGPPSASR